MLSAVGVVLPVAAVHSIDELSAQLSPRDDAVSVVERVKRSVAGALSPLVPVSVGVAPSAWLAKCAAEANKPDAAVVWRPDDLPAVYAGLELEDLPGAAPGGGSHHSRFDSRSFAITHHRRVGLNRGRARPACAGVARMCRRVSLDGARSRTGGCSQAATGAGVKRGQSFAGSRSVPCIAARRAGSAQGVCASRS